MPAGRHPECRLRKIPRRRPNVPRCRDHLFRDIRAHVIDIRLTLAEPAVQVTQSAPYIVQATTRQIANFSENLKSQFLRLTVPPVDSTRIVSEFGERAFIIVARNFGWLHCQIISGVIMVSAGIAVRATRPISVSAAEGLIPPGTLFTLSIASVISEPAGMSVALT